MIGPADQRRCWALRWARRDDAIALIVGDREISYRALGRGIERTAAGLLSRGIRRGDRIAVLVKAGRGFVEILHAAQRIGATLVPLNLRLTSNELAAQVERIRPTLLVVDPEREEAGRSSCAGAEAPRLCLADRLAPPPGAHGPLPPDRVDPSAAHSILFTSGTSGAPRAVALTHANLAASTAAAQRALGTEAHSRWLATMPLFHVGGLAILVRAAILGTAVVLHDGFDEDAVRRDLLRHRVTGLSVVPTMLARLLDRLDGSEDLDHLRCVLVGGAPLPVELARRARAAGLPIAPTYGMTETASQVATASPGAPLAGRGFVGRPLPGIEIRIDAPNHEGRGEILVRGPQIARDLDPGPRTAGRTTGGWLRTGDLGRIDAQQNLYVEDRLHDLIITGGENVYPSEVEQVILAHPAVRDVGVVGAPDSEWGERVEAHVVVEPGASFDPDALGRWVRARLAAYKTPRIWHLARHLPRTPAGKLRRGILRRGDRHAAAGAFRSG